MLTPIPLLIIPLAIYNIIAFITPGSDWRATVASFNLPSGASWQISLGDGFVAISLLILFVELIKATRVSSRSIVDHMLSMLLLIASVVEFLMVPPAGTSTFALLICVMLLDVLTGFSVSIRVAQRDVSVAPPTT